jgi:hypothetical protein
VTKPVFPEREDDECQLGKIQGGEREKTKRIILKNKHKFLEVENV